MSLKLSYLEPNEEGLEGIREAEAILASGGHGFQGARETRGAVLKAEVMARPHAV